MWWTAGWAKLRLLVLNCSSDGKIVQSTCDQNVTKAELASCNTTRNARQHKPTGLEVFYELVSNVLRVGLTLIKGPSNCDSKEFAVGPLELAVLINLPPNYRLLGFESLEDSFELVRTNRDDGKVDSAP